MGDQKMGTCIMYEHMCAAAQRLHVHTHRWTTSLELLLCVITHHLHHHHHLNGSLAAWLAG